MADPATSNPALQRLASLLDRQARYGRTLTYREAAESLQLEPPCVIHQTTRLLEQLMEIDAGAGRPLRASLVVSKVRGGKPAPGFFDKAAALGVQGDEDDAGFHRRQVEALVSAARQG